jgi:SAM-dependent methyltransferase
MEENAFVQNLASQELCSVLSAMDLSYHATRIPDPEYQGYFLGKPGAEHYRLLAYFTSILEGENIIDIGTYKGCSALALSLNRSNTVHTFDIENHCTLGAIAPNVNIYVDSILRPAYKPLIMDSSLILLDTFHDGAFENEFLQYLRDINYEGRVLLDDIHLNPEMRAFWHGIPEDKVDLSAIGHHSGTGLVIFKNRGDRYRKENYLTFCPSPFGFWENHANRRILDSYSSKIKGVVMDIGCNHGASTYWLKDLPEVDEIIGIDINSESLRVAEATFKGVELPHRFIPWDLCRSESLPFVADTIVSFHTLEHIYPADIPTFLANLNDALVPGGHLILSIPYENAYMDPCHVSLFNERTLAVVMEAAGFKVIECFKDDRFAEKNLLTGLFQKPR